MNGLKAVFVLALAMAAGLVAVPSIQAAPAAAPQMRVVSFTGHIQIKIGKDIIGVPPGVKAPVIPAGAEIIIITGEAVLQSGDTVVQAKAGDSFTFNATPAAAGQPAAVQIAATGDKTAVKVVVGKTEATVTKGDVISVAVMSPGKAQVSVVTGKVEVSVNGQTQTLSAGEQTTTTVAVAAPAPAPPPPSSEPAPEEVAYTEPPPPPPPSPSQDNETAPPPESPDSTVSPSSP